MTTFTLPKAFIWRRLHSLMGLWLVLFLIEHLLVNSQAALLLGENGKGFVEMVNSIHNLPYLVVIESLLLGIPFLIHIIWGIKYLFTSKFNSMPTDGSKPSLTHYERNHAYTWQRITSWILVVGVIGHVAKFRFIDYPLIAHQGTHASYFIPVSVDNGLYTVADRLGVTLYDSLAIQKEEQKIQGHKSENALMEAARSFSEEKTYDAQKEIIFTSLQKFEEKKKWVDTLTFRPLSKDQVMAVAPDFGTASLLAVRDTFKNPIYVVLYTIFVLASCFHAFNGFWTFLITWGVILNYVSQKRMVKFAWSLMAIITFLGLISIWGTYWLNLKK